MILDLLVSRLIVRHIGYLLAHGVGHLPPAVWFPRHAELVRTIRLRLQLRPARAPLPRHAVLAGTLKILPCRAVLGGTIELPQTSARVEDLQLLQLWYLDEFL